MEGHLSVPEKTEHEAAASKDHTFSVDANLMFLSLADDRVVRVPVGGVPIRIFLTDPVNDCPATLLRLL